MNKDIPTHRLQKETARLLEDAELEFKINQIQIKIKDVEPTTKTIRCTGIYAEYILAKRVATKKGWTLEYQPE